MDFCVQVSEISLAPETEQQRLGLMRGLLPYEALTWETRLDGYRLSKRRLSSCTIS